MPHRILARVCALALLASPVAALACSGELHIELEQAGVYALDHAAIAAAQPGLADCRADELALTRAGKQVPLHVVARGERFADGDRIEWVGEPLHGPQGWYDPYSTVNVYMLGAAPAPARMRVVAAAGEGRAELARSLHLEQENLMIRLDQAQQKPGEEPDVWQWAKLTQVDPKPFETRFDLLDLDPRSGSATLKLAFRGLSELQRTSGETAAANDHEVDVELNGQSLPPLRWNGRDEVERTLEVPAARLLAQGNRLVLRVPKRQLPKAPKQDLVDVVMFNWIDTHYPARGEVAAGGAPLAVRAHADAPLQLSAADDAVPALYGSDGVLRPARARANRQLAYAPAASGVALYPSTPATLLRPLSLRAARGAEWRAPAQGYDYLIVTHPRLREAIEPLAAFHRARGLSVAVIDIDGVYDQFNHGITHPQAVRNLVDAAWHHWPSKPRFLLLVGDSSFDIRHETYNDLAYAKWTNQELLYPGHFGSVAGGQYANPPKKLSDRNLIPTWQYPSPEGQSASDNWFAAVDGDDWHPVVAVGRFPVVEPAEVTAIVDKTIRYLAQPTFGAWRRDVMFISDEMAGFQSASDEIAGSLGKLGFVADKVYAKPDVTENAVHQRAIHDGIDAGRLLVHFIGHGGRYIWRTGPPDLRNNQDMFTLDDVSRLGNADRLPMVLSMTCYSAPFDNPTEDSIGERFLREKDKGAIAVFAASWRNTPTPSFSRSLIDNLLVPGRTIGDAIVATKRASQDRTLVEMYNLLGDPAVVLERPHDGLLLASDGNRWERGVLVDLRQPAFHGDVNVEWLDAKDQRIASATYRSDDVRFRLAVPDARAQRVRVYAAAPHDRRDAVGGFDFPPAAAPEPSLTNRLVNWWKRLHAKRPVRTPDTIAILDFDGPES